MAEKNTMGAVHLTSLSLDLTTFHENIQQIQDATAQVADTAVENLSKIREALNVPVEKMTFSIDASKLTQDMNTASESVKNLTSRAKEAAQEFESFNRLLGKNAEDLLKGLNLPVNEENKKKLEDLRNALAGVENEYSKVQIKVKDGDLFRATIQSADEAGRTIQTTFDLTGDAVERLQTTIVEKSAQSSRALREQAVSAGVLEKQFESLSVLADALVADFANMDMQTKFPEVAKQAQNFKEQVSNAIAELKSGNKTIEESNAVYNNLWKTQSALSKTWKDITRQATESASSATVDADKINRLALQYANFANTIQRSKWSEDSGIKAMAEEAKNAEASLKSLSASLLDGDTSVKRATGEYEKASAALVDLRTRFADAGHEQEEFLKSNEKAQSMADSYEALQLQLAKLATDMSKFSIKFDSPELENLIAETQKLETDAASAASKLRDMGLEADVTEKDLLDLTQQTNALRLAFEANKKGAADYQKSLQPIQQQAKQTVDALKVLEKSATFQTSKQNVAALRAEYEQFINRLKTTHVGTDAATAELAKLDAKFKELEGTIKTGHTWLETWVNKISESAKWQIANSALSLIRSSFGNLTDTIITTENAVIELQRVLNDPSVTNSAVSDELYNIAYEFGQTFDKVQEVAVKFGQTGIGWQATVEATRATMLGLNTAELEVTTATEGLIAVMAQFNIDAADLEGVIDKINKTADNFPITSEKIVAALQRAGGTASAFGLSLEETIGIITALGKATGRAGEAIGTAMNSLISFSMKDTALAKFSEFLGKDVSDYGVLQLWTELSAAINDSGDELAKLMSQSEEFSSLMDENLASSIGLEEEYTLALKEQNDALKDGKDIYSTVGTYRQNYFIALLNNIDTAIEAINGMGDALGYSMRENETAMEAFSKKWNQLVIAAQELAIQFGEAGFLDLMKGATEAATAVLKLTKNIGGLKTVMLALSSVFFAYKKQKIDETFDKILTSVGKIPASFTAYRNALTSGATATEAMAVATDTLGISMGSLLSIFSLVYAGINTYITWLEKEKQKRQENIDVGKESVKNMNDLATAYKEYTAVLNSGDIEEVNDARENLLQLLGYEEEDVEKLVERYKDLKDGYGDTEEAIRTLTEEEYKLTQARARRAKIDAENAFKDIEGSTISPLGTLFFGGDEMNKFFERFRENLDETDRSAVMLYGDLTYALSGAANGADDAEYKIKVLNAALDAMNDVFDDDVFQKHEALFAGVTTQIQRNTEAIDKNKGAIEDFNAVSGTFEEYLEGIELAEKEAADASGELGDALSSVQWEITETSKAIEELNKLVDTFQSSYKTLTDVIAEYNETGYMTADMLQSILSLEPEYIQLLDNKNGQLSINEERLQDLISANDQYLNQLVALTTAEAIDQEITVTQAAAKAGLTVEEYKLMYATEGLTSQTYALVKQLFDGKITTDEFTSSIATLAEQAGITGEYLDGLKDSVLGLVGGYGALYTELSNLQGNAVENAINNANTKVKQAVGSIKRYYTPPSTSKSASSSAKETDPFKEEKESLKELLEIYEHQIFLIEKNEKTTENSTKKIVDIYRKMQEEVHAQAERYRAAGVDENDQMIRDLQQQWWSYQDKIEEVMEDLYDEVVKSHKNAINLLEHQYESAEQRLDYSYMGENLKKQLDYQVKIQREAERELERLAKLGMDANSDAAQDVIDTWYAAEKAIREISQKIADDILEPFDDFIDLADHFELWDYMDFTKVDYLREKLAALNKLFEDGTISAKQYSEQLRSISYAIYDAQKALYEQERQAVSDRLKGTTDAYKAEQDALKKQKDQLNDYYDSVIDGYNKEIDAWQKKKEQVEDYYDTLIDNLRDVQKANERINKQIDYYNERQKIITNLEQAQARSGVEWREKEMEYQQQLIDLDEEWRRTQEEWSIEDQIEALQKLKDMAISDIDLSIQKIRDTIELTEQAKQAAIDSIEAQIEAIGDLITAAEESAEAEIEVINQKIADMSKTIAESIKNGTVDGLVDSREELDKALVDGTNAMLDFIDKNNANITAGASETANSVYGIYYSDLLEPMNDSIQTVASTMATSLAEGAEAGAKQALSAFQTSFIQPLKKELADLMSQAQKAQAKISSASTGTESSVGSKLTSGQLAAFNSGAGPLSAAGATTKTTLPSLVNSGFQSNLIKDVSSVFGGLKPQNNIYITNNYKTVEEGASGTQRYLSTLGIN